MHHQHRSMSDIDCFLLLEVSFRIQGQIALLIKTVYVASSSMKPQPIFFPKLGILDGTICDFILILFAFHMVEGSQRLASMKFHHKVHEIEVVTDERRGNCNETYNDNHDHNMLDSFLICIHEISPFYTYASVSRMLSREASIAG